jgi:hypothetical protein
MVHVIDIQQGWWIFVEHITPLTIAVRRELEVGRPRRLVFGDLSDEFGHALGLQCIVGLPLLADS